MALELRPSLVHLRCSKTSSRCIFSYMKYSKLINFLCLVYSLSYILSFSQINYQLVPFSSINRSVHVQVCTYILKSMVFRKNHVIYWTLRRHCKSFISDIKQTTTSTKIKSKKHTRSTDSLITAQRAVDLSSIPISTASSFHLKQMMQLRRDNPPKKMIDKNIFEKVLGHQFVCLFSWGRSPSNSGTCTSEESNRPTYNQLVEELNQYKSLFQELQGDVNMLRQVLIEKNIMSHPSTPRVPLDHSFGRSRLGPSCLNPSSSSPSAQSTEQDFGEEI